MKNSTFKQVAKTLKKSIKAKKMTYKDLANQLGVSESGLKKTLSGTDVSLSKLAKICQIIDLPLHDLFLITHEDKQELTFTKKQEEFFLTHPHIFDFFWELCGESTTVEMVQKRYGLTDTSVEKYLVKLDRIGALEYHGNFKIKISYSGPTVWSGKTDLGKVTLDRYQQGHLKTLLNRNRSESKETITSLMNSYMSPETYHEFQQELMKVRDKYISKARREKVIVDPKKGIHVGALIAMGRIQFSDFLEIPNI